MFRIVPDYPSVPTAILLPFRGRRGGGTTQYSKLLLPALFTALRFSVEKTRTHSLRLFVLFSRAENQLAPYRWFFCKVNTTQKPFTFQEKPRDHTKQRNVPGLPAGRKASANADLETLTAKRDPRLSERQGSRATPPAHRKV